MHWTGIVSQSYYSLTEEVLLLGKSRLPALGLVCPTMPTTELTSCTFDQKNWADARRSHLVCRLTMSGWLVDVHVRSIVLQCCMYIRVHQSTPLGIFRMIIDPLAPFLSVASFCLNSFSCETHRTARTRCEELHPLSGHRLNTSLSIRIVKSHQKSSHLVVPVGIFMHLIPE